VDIAALSPTSLGWLAAGLLATGAAAGILAGLLGVGGGIVIVPVLFLLLTVLGAPDGLVMHLCVGTSLATIIPTSISSARAHRRRGAIDIGLLRRWAPFMFAGALAGGLLSKVLDAEWLKLIFGVVALLVSINMALPKRLVLAESLPGGLIASTGFPGLIGLFSSLMGIGGGTLSVPLLTMFSYPVQRAVGTASAFGLVIAVPATAGFIYSGWREASLPLYSLGYVSVPAALLILATSVPLAPLGSRLAHWLNPRYLRLAFAVFLCISAVKMLHSAL
jgi:uncharacterized membrane protein YfcA